VNKLPAKRDGEEIIEQVVPGWVATMRTAAMKVVTEKDVTEIVQAQVKAAKNGNKDAIRFVFEQILGGGHLKGATFIQNNYNGADLPGKPTGARPGSAEKLAKLRQRAQAGAPVFLPGDGATGEEE